MTKNIECKSVPIVWDHLKVIWLRKKSLTAKRKNSSIREKWDIFFEIFLLPTLIIIRINTKEFITKECKIV
jgi:hypothetical protein